MVDGTDFLGIQVLPPRILFVGGGFITFEEPAPAPGGLRDHHPHASLTGQDVSSVPRTRTSSGH
jgi:hypothetical protein